MSKWIERLTLFTWLGVALSAHAGSGDLTSNGTSAWQVSGFLTQVWSLSDRNNFFGRSSDSNGSLGYHEFGINGVYRVDNNFRLAGQLLSRESGEVDDGDPTIDYLFADWSVLQRPAWQAGVRLGRVKNPIGFYNETRDVAFTRPSIMLPQSIYLDRVRNLELSSDGVGLYLRHDREQGSWLFDLVLGEPQMDETTEYAILGRDWQGQFNNSRLGLLRLLSEHEGGRWRGAFTYIDATAPFDPGPGDPITPGEVDFELFGYSAQFNGERWSLTGEYVEEYVNRINLGGLFNGSNNRIRAYFVQAEYRLDPRWTLLARYDDVVVDEGDPDGVVFQQQTGLPSHQRFAKDWTLGAGYQLTPRLHLRGELHQVDGTAWLSTQDNPSPAALSSEWTLLMLQLSYRF